MGKIVFLLMLACWTVCASPLQVKLSDFNPTAKDAGKALQQAIDSGAAEIIVENPGFELITNAPVKLRSNLKIIFRDGVVLSAARNKFKSNGSALFSGVNVNNLEIRGEGKVVLKMNKADYQDPKKYVASEWRHLFTFKGSENITLKNLTMLASGGDGVYLGTSDKNYNKDILLEDLIIKDHHRQGISIISAENVTIRRCELSDTRGTPPAAGIDFEPNSKPGDLRLVNILMEDCVINNNQGNGLEFYTPYIEGKCRPLSITLRRCKVSGNKQGTILCTSWRRFGRTKIQPPRGFITFEECLFENSKTAEIAISDQYNVNVSFKNCRLRPGKSSFPILFSIKAMKGAPVNNVHFDNLIIETDHLTKPVIGFRSYGDANLDNITGNITIVKDGKKSAFDLQGAVAKINQEVERRRQIKFTAAPVNVKKIIAASGVPGSGVIRVRGEFGLVLAGKPGSKNTIYAKVLRPGKTSQINLRTLKNATIASCPIGWGHTDEKLEFTMPAEGFVFANFRIGGGIVEFSSDAALGVYAPHQSKQLAFMGMSGKLNFEMSSRKAMMKLSCATPAQVTIRDEKGNIRFQQQVTEPVYVNLEAPVPDKIWSLEYTLTAPGQALLVQPGLGLDGIFAPDRGTPPLLKVKW